MWKIGNIYFIAAVAVIGTSEPFSLGPFFSFG